MSRNSCHASYDIDTDTNGRRSSRSWEWHLHVHELGSCANADKDAESELVLTMVLVDHAPIKLTALEVAAALQKTHSVGRYQHGRMGGILNELSLPSAIGGGNGWRSKAQ